MTEAEWPMTRRFRAAVRAVLGGTPAPRPRLLDRLRRWARGGETPRRPEASRRQGLLALAGLGRLLWPAGRPEAEAGHRGWAERCERAADGAPTPADTAAVRGEPGRVLNR